jgi:hypothetical protein
MYDIPRPEVLDPERIGSDRDTMSSSDHGDLADRLRRELHDTCAYGQALWQELNAVRRYLVDSLPRPADTGAPLGAAHPTGRDDIGGWQAWFDRYAAVVSVLEGPRGDSGFGRDEARQLVKSRLDFPADQQPTLETIERAGTT